ncbi:putative MFS monocarboxylate transporter [Aspergillus clavatus NRRL 1]|uniref:MFS monocarboxylate transporter, putative n=1 Tax=Aspergillus clavatus (strain ATCC 1007 / CBS 513.65 / DSM 816 / NCTC 3887 / NRRL 1 / QM 1276 / 107) TaxID=344612 RepID=A1CGI0_ASPCL|nr:MFS monocarboxylate transporter, putative [Aspergillus clavatus NRRL 1]EAW11060.1 MFS monocarboxylate transporter, putative [Aspergillus clavatus NRRL 1]
MGSIEKSQTPSLREDEPDTVPQQPVQAAEPVKPIPNGGLQAWLTVVAGFCVFVNSWGLLATYGAFQEYYQTVLLTEQSPSAISWVGSVQATLIVMVGVVTGPLVDSGYLRPLITVGMSLVIFGIMMTSLATKYYQILLAQGFCVGIGGGIAYIPAMVVISSNFTTKRPIAIGCAAIGSSVGSVVFPIMFRQLQPRIGFPWTVRSIGFINVFLALIIGLILCRKPGKRTRARSMIEFKALTDLPFMLFSVSLTCVMIAYYIPLFYVPSYARTQLHTTRSLSFYMVAIINGASAFGRVVPYLLGRRVKPIYVLFSGVAGSALAMFTWIAATSTPGFIVWACYWGFLSGVLVTAPTAIIGHPALCPDPNYLGTRMGMMWGISSFGALVGTPIAGALVDLDQAYFLRAQVFAGCLMLGAVMLQLWPTMVVLRYDRHNKPTNRNIM